MTSLPHTCPDDSVWRAWLDHETDAPEPAHLETCAGCRRVVDELREDASFAHSSMAALAPDDLPTPAEVAVARARLDWRHATTQRRSPEPMLPRTPAPVTRLSTPWRVAAGGLVAALALSLVVAFTPEGNSAAAAFLAQFRSQQVSAVELTPESQADLMRTMNALSNLGTLQVPAAAGAPGPAAAARVEAQSAHPATAAEAASTIGFPLVTPDPAKLPPGVGKNPSIRVSQGSQVRFTFDKNKARAYYQSTGHPEVSLPDKFDGATLVVSIPPAAILEYAGDESSRTAVVVVEAGELVVDVSGNASLPEMRDFLLGLPGLPRAVVSQLKQIQNWNNTLPIPVPVDQVNWQKAKINGADGLLLNDNSGVGSAAVWHANGHLYGVAGSVKANDLKQAADSLAVR